MSTGDPELDELLAPMRDGPIALSRTTEVAAQRERLLRGLRQAVREVPVRRARARRQRFVWSALATTSALAAAGLLAFGLEPNVAGVPRAGSLQVEPLGHESAAWVGADGLRRSIAAAGPLEGNGELVAAAESWSRLSTPQGVRVELAPRTRLRVRKAARDRRSAQLNLVEGEVHCDVPKLGREAQFSIATPSARVIVHGTRFSVRVGGPDRPGTCVRVSEGLVEVRAGRERKMLPPGTQWGCEPQTPSVAAVVGPLARANVATAVPLDSTVEASTADSGPRVQSAPRAQLRKAARLARARAAARRAAEQDRAEQPVRLSGTLAEENRLLAAALTAERGRDAERARELFEQLLARNPSSPLAPEARAGLSRVR